MKNNHNGVYSVHHVLPRSRGGDDSKENRSLGHKTKDHMAFHILFSNMTPEEIGDFLAQYWWQEEKCAIIVHPICNGHIIRGSDFSRKKTKHTKKEIASYKRLFGNINIFEAMSHLVTHWWNNMYLVDILIPESSLGDFLFPFLLIKSKSNLL